MLATGESGSLWNRVLHGRRVITCRAATSPEEPTSAAIDLNPMLGSKTQEATKGVETKSQRAEEGRQDGGEQGTGGDGGPREDDGVGGCGRERREPLRVVLGARQSLRRRRRRRAQQTAAARQTRPRPRAAASTAVHHASSRTRSNCVYRHVSLSGLTWRDPN